MRLNPFVYISETSILFALLIVIGVVMPSAFILDWFFYVLDFGGGLMLEIGMALLPSEIGISIAEFGIGIIETTMALEGSLVRPIVNAITVSLIPVSIYWTYRRFPREIIKKSKLKLLDPNEFTDLWTHVNELFRNAPNVNPPVLMYQPFDLSETPFTFGTRTRMYIGIPGGLIIKFGTDPDGFDSIFSHEIAHLANKDVEKAYLAEATWRTLRIILPAFFVTIVASSIIMAIGVSESLPLLTAIVVIAGTQALYSALFLVVVFAISKRIIRVREFYADARVVEWQRSTKSIIGTLKEFVDEQYSRLRGLAKLHPRISERIHMVKDNLGLFSSSLWISFSLGFAFSQIEYSILPTLWIVLGIASPITELQDIAARATIAVFLFTAIMLAVSSSFHKLALKTLANEKRFFSKTLLFEVAKFSIFFSWGWTIRLFFKILTELPLYPSQSAISLVAASGAWIFHSSYLSFSLIFILLFAGISFPMYASTNSRRIFSTITIFSSALYIINRYLIAELFIQKLSDIFLVFVVSFVFLALPFVFQFVKYKKLNCPRCDMRVHKLKLEANCPNCQYPFYSWAIYPFSMETPSPPPDSPTPRARGF